MKRILLVIIFVRLTTDIFSQVIFIPKIGTSFSGISNHYTTVNYNDTLPDIKQGFVGGIAMQINLARYIAFQTEILYDQKGYKYDSYIEDNGIKEEKFKISQNYLELPISIKFHWLKFYFGLGGSVGYGLGGNVYDKIRYKDGTVRQYYGKVSFSKSDRSSYNLFYINHRIDISAQLSVGFRVARYFFLDFRYAYGLSPVYSQKYQPWGYARVDSKNLSFQTTVSFPIFKLAVGYKDEKMKTRNCDAIKANHQN